VTPAIAPGDKRNLEVLELPFVSPAAVTVGLGEVVNVEELPPLCVVEVENPVSGGLVDNILWLY